MTPLDIAVLGGGLTGLSSAFYLSRRFPRSQITLLEKEARFGGWVRSERVQVKIPRGGDTGGNDTASVLLESGPRTLRPKVKHLLELVSLVLQQYFEKGLNNKRPDPPFGSGKYIGNCTENVPSGQNAIPPHPRFPRSHSNPLLHQISLHFASQIYPSPRGPTRTLSLCKQTESLFGRVGRILLDPSIR
jgi:hypothetical protein